jgi:hypothetical protein
MEGHYPVCGSRNSEVVTWLRLFTIRIQGKYDEGIGTVKFIFKMYWYMLSHAPYFFFSSYPLPAETTSSSRLLQVDGTQPIFDRANRGFKSAPPALLKRLVVELTTPKNHETRVSLPGYPWWFPQE